ncbi:unnamed protein product [Cladocopium goreaui]|uniref:RNA helicase n=2 Tax=Cladocopium goreaui TaxID=2562237 RepID=A0A9P1DV32_9DINO|nr:unnamed protein product [Cladocopium goreaui]
MEAGPTSHALALAALTSARSALHALHSALQTLRQRALKRDFVGSLKQLSRTEWLSLTLLLVLLWRSRRDLRSEASAFLGIFEGAARLLTGRAVRKNFLKDQSKKLQSSCKFSDFYEVFPKWLSEGLSAHSFQDMKPIQRKVLPLALGGHDVVATAPTGSGKTLAFLVPAMVHASSQSAPSVAEGPIVLVLAPTRELVIQIRSVAEKLTSRARGALTVAAVYGGTRKMDQLAALRQNRSLHLLVATVGRLMDFMREHRAFRLRRCSFLVLDEGDKMLDDGFEEEVVLIGGEARRDKQVLFFSATWPPSVERAALRLCSRPAAVLQRVRLEPQEVESKEGRSLPPDVIEQVVEVVKRDDHEHKLPILLDYLEEAKLSTPMHQGGGKVLIFVRTRNAADELATLVTQRYGGRSDAIHGQRKQEQRETSLRHFCSGNTRALITTDVLGRGVDIPDVSLVFIYDFPDDIETYIHRVGRTGRNGRPGRAVSLFVPQYWNSYMAKELQDVLERCQQGVPVALQEAATSSTWNNGWSGWTQPDEL